MTRPNITPGPWKQNRKCPRHIHTSTHDEICTVDGLNEIPKEQEQANAKAIAALPDLLAALEHMHTLLNSPPPNKPGGVSREMIKAALTKAGYTF